MVGRFKRRTLLATTTAATAALAGCTFGDSGDGGSGGGTSTISETPGGPGTTVSNVETEPGTTEASGGQEGRIVPPAIDYGELLTDFSKERFFGLREEKLTLDQGEAISGKHALRVENGKTVSTIAYAPSETLSLEGKNLSMAVKVESPVGGRFEVRLRTPDSSSRYTMTRRLPPAMTDWMRLDMGITRGKNDPDITNIQEIRLEMVGGEQTQVKYWVDDIRITEAQSTPNAILAFYGGKQSHYDNAFPLLEERGWKGTVPVRPSAIGNEGFMDIGQLRELRDAGWDVCSFPLRGKPLPEMSADQQRQVITGDQQFLKDRGFRRGARHFFAPYHSIGGKTVEILREVHDTGFLYGGNSVGVPPTAHYTLPTINGGDLESSRAVILRANLHNQLVTLGFDDVGGEEGMPMKDFEAQLDRIENNDYAGGLNVVTPTQVVDQYWDGSTSTSTSTPGATPTSSPTSPQS